VILGLAVSFLFRALRWLREMGRALAQARREMRRGWECVWAANLCRRDALMFGRLAGQDLLLWRELVLSGLAKREAQAATAATLA
jgi:hypothetical protein